MRYSILQTYRAIFVRDPIKNNLMDVSDIFNFFSARGRGRRPKRWGGGGGGNRLCIEHPRRGWGGGSRRGGRGAGRVSVVNWGKFGGWGLNIFFSGPNPSTKTSTKEFCDTIATSIARYEKVSLAGPLRVRLPFLYHDAPPICIAGLIRPRQGTEICNFGEPSPLDFCSIFSSGFFPLFQVIREGPGSVQFGYGLGVERFEQFPVFWLQRFLCNKVFFFLCFSTV